VLPEEKTDPDLVPVFDAGVFSDEGKRVNVVLDVDTAIVTVMYVSGYVSVKEYEELVTENTVAVSNPKLIEIVSDLGKTTE
jgi:hypothetical protein